MRSDARASCDLVKIRSGVLVKTNCDSELPVILIKPEVEIVGNSLLSFNDDALYVLVCIDASWYFVFIRVWVSVNSVLQPYFEALILDRFGGGDVL